MNNQSVPKGPRHTLIMREQGNFGKGPLWSKLTHHQAQHPREQQAEVCHGPGFLGRSHPVMLGKFQPAQAAVFVRVKHVEMLAHWMLRGNFSS